MAFWLASKTVATRCGWSIPRGLPTSINAERHSQRWQFVRRLLAGKETLFNEIRGVVEKTRNAIAKRDADAALKLNSKFHDLIVESCQNPYLINIMRNIEKLILFYRIALVKKSTQDRTHSEDYFEHLARAAGRQLEIADTMARGNAVAASRLMEKHLLLSAEDMARLLPAS